MAIAEDLDYDRPHPSTELRMLGDCISARLDAIALRRKRRLWRVVCLGSLGSGVLGVAVGAKDWDGGRCYRTTGLRSKPFAPTRPVVCPLLLDRKR